GRSYTYRATAHEKTCTQHDSSKYVYRHKKTAPHVSTNTARYKKILLFFCYDHIGEQSVYELLGIKRLQIVNLLSETDEFDRNVQFAADGDGNATLRRSVKLAKN